MATTEVSICNLALRAIGAKTITAIDGSDDSKEAQVCQDVYALLLDEVLEEHPWDFAKVWLALAVDATYTFIDETYEYAYDKPADWIRRSRAEDQDLQYEIRGAFIVSNTEDMELEYIFREDDPLTYPPHFIKALASRLRPVLAASIKTRFQATTLLEIYYTVDLPKAKQADARGGNPSAADALRHTTDTDSWISARS